MLAYTTARSGKKRNRYLRRLLLGLLVLFAAMAQNVPWLPAFFGVRALLLLPLVVSIAVLEQEVPAICFGALAGLLWDVSAQDPRGWHALFLTVIAFICAMLMRYLFNCNLLTVGLLGFAAAALYLFARWALDSLVPGVGLDFEALLRFYLPRLVYTMALLPLCYWLVRAVVRKTSRRQVGEHIKEEGNIGQIRAAERE
ncbi:MAG: rod shape-determining protein MreD [Oscillospiraceae bacterium]|jgi:rod shape-determining protein MreD|nr:rod shape-determining protein MreD [Oscillospiraceae bacterium]